MIRGLERPARALSPIGRDARRHGKPATEELHCGRHSPDRKGGEYLSGDFPAWTALGVAALAFPGQLLEIKVVALAR